MNLSKREKEVLLLVGGCLTEKEIADKLFISVFTVNCHKKNIKDKLDLKNDKEMVRYCFVNKLIPIP